MSLSNRSSLLLLCCQNRPLAIANFTWDLICPFQQQANKQTQLRKPSPDKSQPGFDSPSSSDSVNLASSSVLPAAATSIASPRCNRPCPKRSERFLVPVLANEISRASKSQNSRLYVLLSFLKPVLHDLVRRSERLRKASHTLQYRQPGFPEASRRSICCCGPNGPAQCRAPRGLRVSCGPLSWDFYRAGPDQEALTRCETCSYEALPPNFSLLQNMVAGAFAGIAVRLFQPYQDVNRPAVLTLKNRNILLCIPSMLSRFVA